VPSMFVVDFVAGITSQVRTPVNCSIGSNLCARAAGPLSTIANTFEKSFLSCNGRVKMQLLALA